MDVKYSFFLLREEYGRRVSDKRVLRKILAPNTEKITDY
jgi:hypothetical protein